jgi:hypothetical protein
MQKIIKTSLLILTLLLIYSCEPEDYEIKPLERCAYSHEFQICACSMYDLMKMKKVGEAYEKPVEYCDDIVGFHKEDWASEITPKGRKLMECAKRYINGQCEK